MSFHAASRAVLALGAPQPPLVCVAETPVREGGCRYCGRARRRSRPPWALRACLRLLQTVYSRTGTQARHGWLSVTRPGSRQRPHRGCLCSVSRAPGRPAGCRPPPRSLSRALGSSSGLRGRACLHELSAQVRSAGWWGRTAGRASWGPDSSSLYTGDVPWEGPFTPQVRKEVARLQQRPFPLPHHKSSRPNDT